MNWWMWAGAAGWALLILFVLALGRASALSNREPPEDR